MDSRSAGTDAAGLVIARGVEGQLADQRPVVAVHTLVNTPRPGCPRSTVLLGARSYPHPYPHGGGTRRYGAAINRHGPGPPPGR